MASSDMTERYERFVDTTCVHKDYTYPFLGLAGECGEVMEEVKKAWRDHEKDWMKAEERVFNIQDELGDVLWYLTRCCHVTGLGLGELMSMNMEKLDARRYNR